MQATVSGLKYGRNVPVLHGRFKSIIAVSGRSFGQKQGTVRPCRLPRMFRHDRSI